MSTTTVRQYGPLRVERSALGQVAEYSVYRNDEYLGGGSKREAMSLYNRLLAREAKS